MVVRGWVVLLYWECGRYVFFEFEDEIGKICVVVFELIKKFCNWVCKFFFGDEIIVVGGVKEYEGILIFNFEKFYLVELVLEVEYRKLKCLVCGGIMKSKGDYLKCKCCGYKMLKRLIFVEVF